MSFSSETLPIVETPLIRLPILDAAEKQFLKSGEKTLEGMTIVISQHLLPSIRPLFEKLFDNGAQADQMHIIGKIYSSHAPIVSWLRSLGCRISICHRSRAGCYHHDLERCAAEVWRVVQQEGACQKRVLIVDHGGFVRKMIPELLLRCFKMVAVEHTSRGFFSDIDNRVPTIDMARDRSKSLRESPIIAKQIRERLAHFGMLLPGMRIGVIGFGAIGSSLTAELTTSGYEMAVYDSTVLPLDALAGRKVGLKIHRRVESLIEESQLLIGCTGRDSLSEVDWRRFSGERILVSASSSDVEFSTLLQRHACALVEASSEIVIDSENLRLRVLNGGFPINFDYQNSSFDASIDLTRALTFLSIIQASRLLQNDLVLPLAREFHEFLMNS